MQYISDRGFRAAIAVLLLDPGTILTYPGIPLCSIVISHHNVHE